MSKPESIKIDPWTTFPTQKYSFINDGFVEGKSAVLKLSTRNRRSAVNIKQSICQDEKGQYALHDQVKLWFELPRNKNLYIHSRSANYIKLHYDHGIIEYSKRNWNIYSSITADKTIQNVSLKLGAAHISPKCHSDNRLRINYQKGSNDVTWYNRTVITHNKLTFGLIGALQVTRRFISKNSVLLGYQFNADHSVFLRADNKDYRKIGISFKDCENYFDTVTLNSINTINANTQFGLEVALNTRGQIFNLLQAVIQKTFEVKDKKIETKLKIKSNLDTSLVIKYPSLIFSELATTSFGVHAAKLTEGRNPQFSYGLQLDFDL